MNTFTKAFLTEIEKLAEKKACYTHFGTRRVLIHGRKRTFVDRDDIQLPQLQEMSEVSPVFSVTG